MKHSLPLVLLSSIAACAPKQSEPRESGELTPLGAEAIATAVSSRRAPFDLHALQARGLFGLCGGGAIVDRSFRRQPRLLQHAERAWAAVTTDRETALEALPMDPQALPHAWGGPPSEVTGPIVAAIRFADVNGDNVFMLSDAGQDAEHHDLRACHATKRAGDRWLVECHPLDDAPGQCPEDDATGYTPGLLSVSDVDGDESAEITFGYTVGCISDVSSVERDLILLENGVRHSIRGITYIGPSDDCPAPGPLRFEDDETL